MVSTYEIRNARKLRTSAVHLAPIFATKWTGRMLLSRRGPSATAETFVVPEGVVKMKMLKMRQLERAVLIGTSVIYMSTVARHNY